MESFTAHSVAFNDIFQIPQGEVHEYSLPMPGINGAGKFVRCDEMAIADGKVIAGPPEFSWQHYNEQAFVELNFVMAGQLCQTHEGLIERQVFRQGYANLLFNPCSWEKNELAGGQGFRNLGIYISQEKMIRLINNYAPELRYLVTKIEKRMPFVMHAPTPHFSPRLQQALGQIWESPVPQGLRRLHFETQILQLFYLQCDALLPSRTPHRGETLRTADKERLQQARQYRLEHLAFPPTLGELSRICGLNEFKLKKKFKETFHTTVFGYLSDYRLDMAKQYLQDTNKAVSDIAYELGYSSPQHFSTAFKKRFGVSPTGLKK